MTEEEKKEPVLTTEMLQWLQRRIAESRGVGPAGEVVALVKFPSGAVIISKYPSEAYLKGLKELNAIVDYRITE